MRLFVAVDLPDPIRERLANVASELSACGADVRWVHADSMHLTLKFLGSVEPRDLTTLDAVLRKVAGSAQPSRGRLRGVGSFPHLRRPRVLWAGVETDDEKLADLHATLDTALAELGFAGEKRPFHPHVTIGRVRSGRGIEALRAALEEQADFDADAFDIRAMTLFESELHRGGARYTALSTIRLGSE